MAPRRSAALLGAAVPFLLSACIASGTNITGATGVAVGEPGSARLVFAICEGSVDFVDLHGPREGAEQTSGEPIGSWTTNEPLTSAAVFDLARPDARWTAVRAPDLLAPGVQYSAFAGSRSDDEQLLQVDFILAQVDALDPMQVLWARSPGTPATRFQDTVCPRRARLPVGP